MSNRLAFETSPYLLQHADNPVEWHPWDDDALRLARKLDKPIVLSIGYSACHWCHVMAHESFEDPAVAEVMNDHFVNIKVDREERPDLDRVYQLAHQLLTQQPGGWPLTMFLDPHTLVPFFGGTYFPRTARYRLPGFRDLLLRVSEVFRTRRDDLATQGTKIAEVLGALNAPTAAADAAADADAGADAREEDTALLRRARETLASQYDSADGGFGTAPKFPMPAAVERLLRTWAFSRETGRADREALDMVLTTLTGMARGGIHDHLGGGFCRYSTDARWMIPHFEKMLYDNGQLLALYSDALGVGHDTLFAGVVSDTAAWLLREMRHPDGGFYAALDADSEGEEGKYYLWHRNEVKQALTDAEYLVVETLYGLDKPANFEGRWNLHRHDAWRSVVSRLSLEPDQAEALLDSARRKLLAEREQRVRPATDDKILTAWNALAIKGLTKAAIRLDRPEWLAAAQQCADFLRGSVLVAGTLHATWQRGRARHPGYLDDYACLLDALLELLSAEWRAADAALAVTLADRLLEQFEDAQAGGFFFTAHDHETLIYRPKPTQDDALPAGNAMAARALWGLGQLMGEQRYLDAAERTLAWARDLMAQAPAAHCGLLTALETTLAPPEQIIVRGPADTLGPWLARARRGFHPWRRVYGIAHGQGGVLPPYLPDEGAAGRTVAYRCEGFSCSLPMESLAELDAALGAD
ncbi:MAG: thioredoxin domain-containing protein [Pseudomonadota bacterium]